MNQNETLGKILAVLERIATGIEDIKVQQVFGPVPVIPGITSERPRVGEIRYDNGTIFDGYNWVAIDEYRLRHVGHPGTSSLGRTIENKTGVPYRGISGFNF